MADLSPQAQAVFDAYCEGADNPYSYDGGGLVAALRAAADQMSSHQSQKFLYSIADAMKLRDIADELEGSND